MLRSYKGDRGDRSCNDVLHPISDGIHALVQPLTAAQCLLEFTLFKGGTDADYRAAIEKAMSELQRMSGSITFMRELIRIQQGGMEVISFSLKPVVESVVAEFHEIASELGVDVALNEITDDPSVTLSPMRLRQGLFYVIQSAQQLCDCGQKLQVSILPAGGRVEVRVELNAAVSSQPGESSPEPVIGGADKIAQSLHLAEAIMTQAGGEFSFSESPLVVSIFLPTNSKEHVLHAPAQAVAGNRELTIAG